MSVTGIDPLVTGIDGLDHLVGGGLPRNRVTLVSGTAGSGKTILALQYLAAGVSRGEAGVFVAFEECADDIRRNVASLGWDLEAWEAGGDFALIDASPDPGLEVDEVGGFELGGLTTRIERAVRATGAQRVALDSLHALMQRYVDTGSLRRGVHQLIGMLRSLRVTAVLTAERAAHGRDVAYHPVEEYVADNVLILRNTLAEEQRRRTIEVLKIRGGSHRTGEFPFTIAESEGIVITPVTRMSLTYPSSSERVSSGLDELDEMLGGGLLRSSITLVSGATGTGKTLLSTEFLSGGAAAGERGLLLSFEESGDQIVRNASVWGKDLPGLSSRGLLHIDAAYPESGTTEDHLLRARRLLDEVRPDRVAIDSISALERSGTRAGFRELVISLASLLKRRGITTILTSTYADMLGGTSATGVHVSTLTDAILLLRYVELRGELRRGLTVLKTRGSAHDVRIREFWIDDSGMQIGDAFTDVGAVLLGQPRLNGTSTAPAADAPVDGAGHAEPSP